jgi:SAM-dependent methyltransferase
LSASSCEGTGGHALPLAQRGLHVTGVDLSARMLACAQNKAHKLGVGDRIGDGPRKGNHRPNAATAAAATAAATSTTGQREQSGQG